MFSSVLKGIGSNFFAQFIVAAMQIVSVPVFVHVWGIERYGLWLMLYTIPAYLTLTDLGLATTAGSDMTARIATGDTPGALQVYRVVWVFVSLVALGLTLVGSLGIASAPDHWFPRRGITADDNIRRTLQLLLLYAVLILQSNLNSATFRAAGFYPFGTFVLAMTLLIEGVAAIGAAYCFGAMWAVAATLLGARAMILGFSSLALRRLVPWLSLRGPIPSFSVVRHLLVPSGATMANIAAETISLQGLLLVIGTVMSPRAAAIFGSVRTLSRFTISIASSVNNSVMPVFGAASARGDDLQKARLVLGNAAAVLVIVALSGIMLCGFGVDIMRLWTGNAIVPAASLIIALWLVAAIRDVWHLLATLLMATNRHSSYSFMFLAMAIACVVLAIPVVRHFGLAGATLCLIAMELVMVVTVIRTAIRLSLFSPRAVLAQLRHIGPAVRGLRR